MLLSKQKEIFDKTINEKLHGVQHINRKINYNDLRHYFKIDGFLIMWLFSDLNKLCLVFARGIMDFVNDLKLINLFHATGRFLYTLKISENLRKTNIFYPLIRTRTCAYHGVRNVSFSEVFYYFQGFLMF